MKKIVLAAAAGLLTIGLAACEQRIEPATTTDGTTPATSSSSTTTTVPADTTTTTTTPATTTPSMETKPATDSTKTY